MDDRSHPHTGLDTFENARLVSKLVDLLLELRDLIELANGRQRLIRGAPSEWEMSVDRFARRAVEEVDSLLEGQIQ